MRIPCVAGNWKMNKTVVEAEELVEELILELEQFTRVENVICPPFTSLAPVARLLADSPIALGAQNMYWEEQGAYTGEVSPAMVAELATHVILGHSERRAYFNETDRTVNRRVLKALEFDLVPIVCVGETLDENESGRTSGVVSRQVDRALQDVELPDPDRLMIAYEPVWAIGTGKAATPEGANQVIAEVIRPALADRLGSGAAQAVRVLYGGSVKPHNAAEFFSQPDIDGALVGGASLDAGSFAAITREAEENRPG